MPGQHICGRCNAGTPIAVSVSYREDHAGWMHLLCERCRDSLRWWLTHPNVTMTISADDDVVIAGPLLEQEHDDRRIA